MPLRGEHPSLGPGRDGADRGRTKDLRDTFTSQVLRAGVQLGYVSRQPGHTDVSVTARHYAKWAGDDSYRHPLEVGEDEVPADLLSRLAAKSRQSPHSAAEASNDEAPGTSRIPGA